MNTPDGGPAFPVMVNHIDQPGSSEVLLDHEGMSLRDYFAAAPMSDAELETLREAYGAKFPGQPLSISKMRYWRADTMLEARAQWYNEKRVPSPLVAPAVMQSGEEVKPPEAESD